MWGWRRCWYRPWHEPQGRPPPYGYPPYFEPIWPPVIPPEEEVKMLEEERAYLEKRLDDIIRRLKELKEQ